TMQEIVRYRQRWLDEHGKVQGSFESTGVQPSCLKRFDEMGIPFDPGRIAAMERPTTNIWAAQ
ncbi:MAG: hypothetical protein JOZ24_09130, partial [Candidatus Eremiobacteraeota bacterium]|nr:hypothetical protein [Candidatus Eremiobacteraeota bacterium]